MSTDVDEFLMHFGVKGMKWGVRRDDAVLARIAGRRIQGETKEDRQRYKDYKKSTSRKDRRADRREARLSKANKVVEDALKARSDDLVSTMTPQGYRQIMTAKDFVTHLSNGGYFDAMSTEVINLDRKSKS